MCRWRSCFLPPPPLFCASAKKRTLRSVQDAQNIDVRLVTVLNMNSDSVVMCRSLRSACFSSLSILFFSKVLRLDWLDHMHNIIYIFADVCVCVCVCVCVSLYNWFCWFIMFDDISPNVSHQSFGKSGLFR